MTRDGSGRAVAALGAAAAAASLAGQWVVVAGLTGGAGPLVVLVVMLAFFTIWSNALGLGTLLAASLRPPGRGRRPSWWQGGVTAWLLLTAAAFHLLIAGRALEDGPFSAGLGLWAAQGLHSVVPALALLHWLVAAPRDLRWRDAATWLGLPVAYLALVATGAALAGGAPGGSGGSPYPFLDVAALGVGGVALRLLGLVALALGLGLALVAVARLSPGRAAPRGPRPR